MVFEKGAAVRPNRPIVLTRMTPDRKPAVSEVFVGRQPIYGRRLELFAYELLYRGADVDFADFTEGDRATSQVLLNTFTEFGLDRVVGGHTAFVNLTRGFVTGEYPLPVPRDRVVLEILEDIAPDAEGIAGIRSLRKQGFTIALDDFIFEERMRPLLALADIVKVDVLDQDDDEVRRRAEVLRPFKCRLLAEKIESRAQFEVCLEAGYDLFQGYFLARPNVVQGTSVGTSRLSLLRLLARLQDPACPFDEVETIVGQDVSMTYRLLRHINAAMYGMPRKIESVRETVVYLGLSTVKNLACLFLLSTIDDKPHELLVTSMLRARFALNLAEGGGRTDAQSFFAAGLFSTLDALLDVPMEQALSQLPLAEDLRRALLEGIGPLGASVNCVIAYEHGDWDQVRFGTLTRSDIRSAFLEAVAWVEGVDQELARMAA